MRKDSVLHWVLIKAVCSKDCIGHVEEFPTHHLLWRPLHPRHLQAWKQHSHGPTYLLYFSTLQMHTNVKLSLWQFSSIVPIAFYEPQTKNDYSGYIGKHKCTLTEQFWHSEKIKQLEKYDQKRGHLIQSNLSPSITQCCLSWYICFPLWSGNKHCS